VPSASPRTADDSRTTLHDALTDLVTDCCRDLRHALDGEPVAAGPDRTTSGPVGGGSTTAEPADATPTPHARLDAFDLAPAVVQRLQQAATEPRRTAATAERDRLESALTARLPDGYAVVLDCDPESAFVVGYADRLLAGLGASVASEIRRRLADALDSSRPRVELDRARADLGHEFESLADAVDRLARRVGRQAVAETVSVVTDREWVARDDCPHAVHESLAGVTVAADESFAVDAEGTIRSAFVVGEDRPLTCRCRTHAVVPETPDAPRELAALDGVTVRRVGDGADDETERVEPLTERQREVKQAHAREGETFPELVQRIHRTDSVRGGARRLGVAKKTLYRWFDAHVPGFDRYSGR
jgi:hypothetical protein